MRSGTRSRASAVLAGPGPGHCKSGLRRAADRSLHPNPIVRPRRCASPVRSPSLLTRGVSVVVALLAHIVTHALPRTGFGQKSRLSEVTAVVIKVKQRGTLRTKNLGEVRVPLSLWWEDQQRDEWIDIEPRRGMRYASRARPARTHAVNGRARPEMSRAGELSSLCKTRRGAACTRRRRRRRLPPSPNGAMHQRCTHS